MKVRKCFVSNSSSSSFVCDVCGHDESGWDLGLRDAGMYECVNGHVFCEGHVKEIPWTVIRDFVVKDLEKYIGKYGDDQNATDALNLARSAQSEDDWELARDDDWINDTLYEAVSNIPEALCPICSFQTAKPDDILTYVLLEEGKKPREVLDEIIAKFDSYKEFKAWLSAK